MIKTDVSPLDIKCTCCCGEEDLKDIAFGHDKVWTAVCLCRNCRNELRRVLGDQEPDNRFTVTCIFCLNKFKTRNIMAEICPECQRKQSEAAKECPDLTDEI